MPCNTIQTNTVKLAGNTDADLLARAMMALGVSRFEYVHDQTRGTVTIRGLKGQEITQANIAQAYSAEIVKSTAAKRGWKLKQVAPFKYAVTKGGI